MRISFILIASLLFAGIAAAQEFEVFTGDPAGTLPTSRPENYLAKCLAGNRMACEIFKSQSNKGGLEAGDIERAEYVACNNKGGVCLELATLDLDEQDTPAAPKTRLPTIDINILFDYEKADVKSSEEQKLQEIARALKDPANAKTRFAIIGHTDARGAERYNCRLSSLRAKAVSSRLAALGIGPNRLVAIGAGEYVLRDKQHPQAAQNRRVGFARLDKQNGQIVDRLAKLCDSE